MVAPPTRARRRGDTSVSAHARSSSSSAYCVGTPIIAVTRRSRISCSARAGWKERSRTTVAPTHHASSGWQFHAATWNWGSIARTTSSCVSGSARASARLFQKQLAWVSTTPFGAASLPDVKITSSGSSSRTCRGGAESRAGGTDASTPVVPRWAAGGTTSRARSASSARDAYSSSMRTSAGSARRRRSLSSRGVSRHDSGTNATPASAHAKKATTWSVELPEMVASRCPGP